MLNVIISFKPKQAGQLEEHVSFYEHLKQKYNPNDKLSRAQMIKKLNKIKPKKQEDPKVMCNKV